VTLLSNLGDDGSALTPGASQMGSSECGKGGGALGCEGAGAKRKRGIGALDISFFSNQRREGGVGVNLAWPSG
jgi:hypothetical protein